MHMWIERIVWILWNPEGLFLITSMSHSFYQKWLIVIESKLFILSIVNLLVTYYWSQILTKTLLNTKVIPDSVP